MTEDRSDLDFLLPPMSYRQLAMATYDLAYRCDDPALMSEFIALAGRCLRRAEEGQSRRRDQDTAAQGASSRRP